MDEVDVELAIKKQIAEKPENVVISENGVDICSADCPTCGSGFPDIGYLKHEKLYDVVRFYYCPVCGQKIDWDSVDPRKDMLLKEATKIDANSMLERCRKENFSCKTLDEMLGNAKA